MTNSSSFLSITQGGITSGITMTAFVLIALLEADLPGNVSA